MVGLLVVGDNHLVVRGPEPDDATAAALATHWSIIRIGGGTPDGLDAWSISTREFREDLEWAVVVGGGEPSPAVAVLLGEMEERGVRVRRVRPD
jgi:hypothetical protein